MHIQLTLDSAEGQQLKTDGQAIVEEHNSLFVDAMRTEAKRISAERGFVSSDDLRLIAQQWGIEPKHQNAWGAIFRGKGWKIVGRRRSTVPGNHAREIKIWQYEP